MVGPVESVLEGLSVEERLSLIHALWDSLSDEDTPLSEAQRAELERRLASFETGRSQAVSWQELRDQLLARRKIS